MKPILKWVGGKTQILDVLDECIPDEMENYYEPFLGGGSVLLMVLEKKKVRGKVYASDVNKHLIDMYIQIQQDPTGLLKELRTITDEFESLIGTDVNRAPKTFAEAVTSKESYYYWVRSSFNSDPSPAKLIFLNKTCFRGVYREGPNGFNVPYGHYKNPQVYDWKHIQEVSKLIQGVEFRCEPFDKALARVQTPRDFVYLDPPYAPEKQNSFVGYTSDGFDKHEALFTLCKNLPCQFVMSNSKVSLVTNAFDEEQYNVQVVSCKRSINSKHPESRTDEVIISKAQN